MKGMGFKIISGNFKGRKVVSKFFRHCRPTKGEVREALFNILGNAIQGAHFADLFAGTGMIGFEALSRGAHSVLFVELDFHRASEISKNIRILSVSGRVERCNVYSRKLLLAEIPLDFIYCDPPYDKKMHRLNLLPFLKSVFLGSRANPMVILEKRRGVAFEGEQDWFSMGERRYGSTILSFLIGRKIKTR